MAAREIEKVTLPDGRVVEVSYTYKVNGLPVETLEEAVEIAYDMKRSN